MKKILLVSNYVYHYRIRIYNYLFEEFKKAGYEFVVFASDAQKVKFPIKFELIIKRPFFFNYLKVIKDIGPDYIITFLHLKDIHIFPIKYYARINRIPVIYWNHGINIKTPNNKIKRFFFNHIHNISDAIILYSPLEKVYIKEKYHHKVFIANNTLNFEEIVRGDVETDRRYVRDKYKIKEDEYVLFVGRITKTKKLDVLLSILTENKNIAVVVVGPGLTGMQKQIIDRVSNFYYLGTVYGNEVNRIFNGSKIFCMPGNIGLALNESFFWGKPAITMEGRNTPEIYYLKNGENGYIVKNKEEIERKIQLLIDDRDLYKKMAANARNTANNESHIGRMFGGFLQAIDYLNQSYHK